MIQRVQSQDTKADDKDVQELYVAGGANETIESATHVLLVFNQTVPYLL